MPKENLADNISNEELVGLARALEHGVLHFRLALPDGRVLYYPDLVDLETLTEDIWKAKLATLEYDTWDKLAETVDDA